MFHIDVGSIIYVSVTCCIYTKRKEGKKNYEKNFFKQTLAITMAIALAMQPVSAFAEDTQPMTIEEFSVGQESSSITESKSAPNGSENLFSDGISIESQFLITDSDTSKASRTISDDIPKIEDSTDLGLVAESTDSRTKMTQGSLTESDSINYYKFTIASSGRVKLVATAKISDIIYCFYDESKDLIYSEQYCWNNTTQLINTNIGVDLTKGTYYFAAKQAYGRTGTYSFRLTFTSAGESFTETGYGSNNNMDTASQIKVNTSYKGQIADNDDKDFYKFTLPSSGRITLSVTAKMCYVTYYVYDQFGEKLWRSDGDWNSTTELNITNSTLDLTKGTYYFITDKSFDYTGNYTFKLGYTSANESFSEIENGSNNSLDSANNIYLNTIYKGQIAENDDKDFYTFKLNSASQVQFTATTKMNYLYYRIYDNVGNQLWSLNSYRNWNSTTQKSILSENIDLKPGTYYFCVERNYSTGPYTFKMVTPHTHTYKNYITKATPKSNGKIAKRCSCGVTRSSSVIYVPAKITLSANTYQYDETQKTPSVTVRNYKGKIISSSNYKVSYSTGRTTPGTYSVKVTFKGSYYSGSITKKFKITN